MKFGLLRLKSFGRSQNFGRIFGSEVKGPLSQPGPHGVFFCFQDRFEASFFSDSTRVMVQPARDG